MNGFQYLKPHIRWMIRREMPDVLANEEAAFGVDAWGEDDFSRCLCQRNCIGMVAEHGDILVGHMVYELNLKHINLLNFAVHPAYQRRGVGMCMLAKLVGKLAPQRRTAITVLVSETNMPALKFFKAMQFRATGIVWDAFPDCGEDGYAMELRVGAAVRIAG